MHKNMKEKIESKIDTETKDELRKFAYENKISLAETTRIAFRYFLKSNNDDQIFNKDNKLKRELVYELRRFGNNLNQLTYKLNVALKTNDLSAADKVEIKYVVTQINPMLEHIKQIHSLLDKRL